MRKMLSNKGLRFVTTLIFIVLTCLLFSLLPKLVMGDRYTYVDSSSVTLLLATVMAVVLQLIGDVLYSDKTEHGFLAVVRRVVFDAVAVFTVLLAFGLSLSSWAKEGADLNLFETALMNARTFVLPVLCFVWLIATTKKMPLAAVPFYYPASMAAGYVLALIFSAVFKSMPQNKSGIIFALIDLAFLVGMIVWRIKVGAAFSNMGTDGGEYASFAKTTYTPSYQTSSSGSSSVRASEGRTSVASHTPTTATVSAPADSSDDEDDDDEESDENEDFDIDEFRSDLADEMDSVTDLYSGSESFGEGYSKVVLNVECRINHADHTVNFFVNGRTVYSGERSVSDSEDINYIYRTTKEGIIDDAEDYIGRLRDGYGPKAPHYYVKVYINR